MSCALHRGGGGGKTLSEEEAADWMRRLTVNTGTLCFEAVGVSVDDLRGVEWLNGVGKVAREGCVRPNMQVEADVKRIRGIMEDPKCMWLQVDVGGGGWATCDSPVVVNDWYVAAGALGDLGVAASGVGGHPATPQVILPLRRVAEELGTLWSDNDEGYSSNVEMGRPRERHQRRFR